MATSITKQTGFFAEALNTYLIDMAEEWQEPLKKELEIEMYLDPVFCEETYAEPTVAVQGVIQAYKGKFSPSGTIQVGSVHNTLSAMKTDLELQEDQLEHFAKTQFPKYHGSKNQTMLDNKFIQKFMNQFLLNQWKREMNQVSIKGEAVAVTNDTAPGPVMGAITGFNKFLNDGITAGRVNSINMDFSSSTDFSVKLKNAIKQLPEELYNLGGKLFLPYKHMLWYSEDYRAKNGHSLEVRENGSQRKMMINDFNFEIVPIEQMAGLDRVWLDINADGRSNMTVGKHSSLPDMPSFSFVPLIRGLHVKGDWHRFYGLRRYEYTFVMKPA